MNLTWRNFFMPLKCPICRDILPFGDEGDGIMCKFCRTKWETEKQRVCSECGLSASDCKCMPEQLKRAKADALIKLRFYEADSRSATDRLILYIKDYRDGRIFGFAARELCRALGSYFKENSVDPAEVVFTYLPRSRKSIYKKGFDQARILSKRCAKHYGASFVTVIRRKLLGKEQKGLSTEKRIKNAQSSFLAESGIDLSGATVVLIDDMVTTGASLSSCVNIIKNVGAKRVICLCIAQTEKITANV